jgi:hypothetical protein
MDALGSPVSLDELMKYLERNGTRFDRDDIALRLSRGKDKIYTNPFRGTWGLHSDPLKDSAEEVLS